MDGSAADGKPREADDHPEERPEARSEARAIPHQYAEAGSEMEVEPRQGYQILFHVGR